MNIKSDKFLSEPEHFKLITTGAVMPTDQPPADAKQSNEESVEASTKGAILKGGDATN